MRRAALGVIRWGMFVAAAVFCAVGIGLLVAREWLGELQEKEGHERRR